MHTLPFDDAFKVYVLESIDTLDLERKSSIERIMWDLYDLILTLKYEENVQAAFEEAKIAEIKPEINDAFYAAIRERTQQEMLKEHPEKNSYIDLALTRSRLQKMIGEKQPSSLGN